MRIYTLADLYAAIDLAWIAHADQKRRDGQAYIFHPLQVMLNVKTIEAKIVAVLHDVVEDTGITVQQIKDYIGAEIAQRVWMLTRDSSNMSYEDYIDRIAESDDPIIREVKIADLKHNLATIDYVPSPKKEELHKRYTKALAKLINRSVRLDSVKDYKSEQGVLT